MTVRPITSDTRRPAGAMRDTSAQDSVVAKPGRRRLWITLASVLGLVVAAVGLFRLTEWFSLDQAYSRDRLRIGAVTEGEFVRDIPIQGVIVAAVKPTLFAPSPGRVNLRVAAGDRVVADDVLAVIESPELMSTLAQAKAELDAERTEAERAVIEGRQQDLQNQQAVDLARVAVTAAERELRRAEASWEYQVISLQDFEQAKDELERARLEYEHRRADADLYLERFNFERKAAQFGVDQRALAVAELERQWAALTVKAPVSGIVGTISVEDRAAVIQDTPLLSVVDLERLELEVPLAQGYADDVAIGLTATISYGGSVFDAVVSSLSPEVENNTVATRLRFSDAQPSGLRQNQRLTGRIELDRLSSALQVPRGSWFDAEGGRAAYVVEGDYAIRRSVTAGAASAQFIQIVDGLDLGEQIVLSNTSDFEGRERILLTQ
ncbi:MAG: HlyD family efflux transporter periplasmic adaptor subunit [Pseudomonadota bacterium]